MALINCKECGAQVGSTALTCPSCGTTLRKPKRGVFGQISKWLFILFNLLMLWWFVAGMGAASDGISGADSDAGQAGAAIGTGLGAMFIIFIWVAGDVILGLLTFFTRAKK
ncbi:zinc ribbon domain-containing protein [Kaistella jeonii]|uniref:Seryl-tRNA synthetase, class IIa n=1 Tax=Kaistella jeonii TaxID=266749 RepID=A0A0C1FRI4_9FLAO|nr:zinc ribbon domain-containing protein [Kaistella jeonii]KIA90509.1 seryl-tRNA synthetase, class IIa [Kaistella jeonii]SFB71613.1 hypothetical protein SAMN05421876_101313 [Kaistella jeonii]VEI94903.1 Uncharacterised protein [Kaistella jeonii]